MKSLCFILPANFVDDHELNNHNKDEETKSKQLSQIHSKAPIWRSVRQTLNRFLEWKWTSSCHKKHPTFVFHDTEGVQFLEKIGSDNPRIFSYAELFVGSNGFDKDQVLGSGGFGRVYRAVLPSDGTVVAVKCLMERGNSIEKTFAAELAAVANLRHRNLVKLRGWCVHDDQLLLVYDYMPNRSLDRLIFKQKGNNSAGAVLSWERRKKIATGLAAALFYLHEQLETQIIHRDVKASNVMLDSNFSARLGDFGLARWLEHDINYESTPSTKNQPFRLDDTSKIGGTIGYLPPESFQKKAVSTAKSDVFSFGIVALEIASGRRAVDLSHPDDQVILLDWIRKLSDEKLLVRAADARLPIGSYKLSEMERLIHIGLICTSHDPQSRPPMRWVLDALSDSVLCKLPDLPLFKSHPLYISLSSSPTTNTGGSITTGRYTFTDTSPTAFDSTIFVTANGQTLFQTAEDGSSSTTTSQDKYNRSQHCKIPNVETPREISYNEILIATNRFSDSNKIAEIDFGTAYHGVLENSHHVIIKRLGMPNCPVLRMRFSNELKSVAQLRHKNLVQLRGWCTEHGEMLVAYDYSPSNLLSHLLFHYDHKSRGRKLQWNQRYKIIKSLASAIYYLHEEWDEQVIHGNITSSAICLDPDMNPRLGSFSLAKFLSRNDQGQIKVEQNRAARGIFGHMAPEYMKSGEATTMADVYSFGIVLLEVVTGQMAVDFRLPEVLLVKKVHRFETHKKPLQELADIRLDGVYDEKELMRVIKVGIACTRSNLEERPSMQQIVNILDGHDQCFVANGQKRESRREWRQNNASSLSLIREIQGLGIQ